MLADLHFQVPDDTVVIQLFNVRYEGKTVPSIQLGEISLTTVTVLDDGDAGTFEFARSIYQVPETPGAYVNVTVTRVGRSTPSGAVSVLVTSRDGTAAAEALEYIPVHERLLFPSGLTSMVLPARGIDNDHFDFPFKDFLLELSDMQYGGQRLAVQRIGSLNETTIVLEDDGDAGTMQLVPTQAVRESFGDGRNVTLHTFTVTRTGGSSRAVLVFVTTVLLSEADSATAADFIPATFPLHFADGATNRTFEIGIIDDNGKNRRPARACCLVAQVIPLRRVRVPG